MNTDKATHKEHKAIGALLKKLNIQDQRAELIYVYTGGRSRSGSGLQSGEAADLIKYLKTLDPDEKMAERMRRKIIAYAHEMKWYKPGSEKVDMERLDNWCMKFSYLKKKLNQYLYRELPALITQFESVYASFLKSI